AVFLRAGAPRSKRFQLRLLSKEPMVVVLPKNHPAAARKEIDLAVLKDEPFLLFPRATGPRLYDTIVGACETAGFEPKVAQLAPQIASIVNLVAAELGVSIVPASMSQLRVTGVAYRQIAGQSPIGAALFHRVAHGAELTEAGEAFLARSVSLLEGPPSLRS